MNIDNNIIVVIIIVIQIMSVNGVHGCIDASWKELAWDECIAYGASG